MSDYSITCIGVVILACFVCLIDISANIAKGIANSRCARCKDDQGESAKYESFRE